MVSTSADITLTLQSFTVRTMSTSNPGRSIVVTSNRVNGESGGVSSLILVATSACRNTPGYTIQDKNLHTVRWVPGHADQKYFRRKVKYRCNGLETNKPFDNFDIPCYCLITLLCFPAFVTLECEHLTLKTCSIVTAHLCADVNPGKTKQKCRNSPNRMIKHKQSFSTFELHGMFDSNE